MAYVNEVSHLPPTQLSASGTRHGASTEYSLTVRIQRYVVIATKPVHWLQIRPIVHNLGAPLTIPPNYIWLCSSAGMQRRTDTDRQTHRCIWPV